MRCSGSVLRQLKLHVVSTVALGDRLFFLRVLRIFPVNIITSMPDTHIQFIYYRRCITGVATTPPMQVTVAYANCPFQITFR